MNVQSTGSGYDAFFAVREAAARRMAPVRGPESARTAPVANKSLTTAPRPVDPLTAAQSAGGPIKGRIVDFIA